MSKIACGCTRSTDLPSVWYISLFLNSLAITVSHVVGVTIFTELRDNNHIATSIAMSTGIVLLVSLFVYAMIYSASGYVPMGRISQGLRFQTV